MKKLISLLLALMMVFSLAVTAFADDADPNNPTGETGSITIDGVGIGTKYSIYRLLDLETFVKDAAYSYKINEKWDEFFALPEMANYATVDSSGYVTWVGAEDEDSMAAFAKSALKYAQENNIEPEATKQIETGYTADTYKFENLPLGWYLVDSTAGALCGLTTTDKDAVIVAKNHVPTIDKQVQEDLTGNWQGSNTADIGQIVYFKSIIHVAAGAENYVIHDTMSGGLTFEHTPGAARGVTKITHTNSQGTETVLTEGTEYTVLHKAINCEIEGCTTHCEDTCSFEVVFDVEYVKTLKANDRIQVEYNAMLNRHAVIAGNGNPNEVKLEYGENHYTIPATTKTTTFSFDIVKTTTSNTMLAGAKFRIYDAATGGNEIEVVPLEDAENGGDKKDENGNQIYRRARDDEEGVEIYVEKPGPITVVGLDNGEYYLEETVAPTGYNKLADRKHFTISEANVSARFDDGIYATGSGVQVVNKTGTMLPETGAMGTTLFIAFGMFAVLATGVLLVTKKRMSMIVD